MKNPLHKILMECLEILSHSSQENLIFEKNSNLFLFLEIVNYFINY